MVKRLRQLGLRAGLILAVSSLAPAYYHFIHFTSFLPPFAPVPEKFDLRALVDNTVRYYISSVGPATVADGDSLTSVISQIRLAAQVWNDVPTSSLRVAFGGIVQPETPQTAPGIDIIFDEIPPGLIALGGPSVRAEMVATENGAFVPITRSVVILNRDLSGQPSFSEGFFLTVVHELGHALGLQHTLTSSVMSTSITRATSKAAPLAADDIAAISLLYPAPGFAAATGTIRGRVVLLDQGVHLASVVAISPEGPAVSALTHPDGSYEIQGIPPGTYYVYAHPLPPPVYGEASPANIVLPRDPAGEPIPVGPYFQTQFYPGVQQAELATAFDVVAGARIENVDFFVRPSGAPELFAITTFSFPGNVPVTSGHLSMDAVRRFVVASGMGLSTGAEPAPGLTASILGGAALVPAGGLLPYAPDPRFVQINIDYGPQSGFGPRHMLFSRNGEVYVLPAALHLTEKGPPFIEAVAPELDAAGRLIAAVTGTNLSPSTKILFDGVTASPLGMDEAGRLLVEPPSAPGGHRAAVLALNPDGQSSWFLNGADSPVFQYPESPADAISIMPSELAAGTEALVTIQGLNTRFAPGQVSIGAGSSDVTVREFQVLDPSLILANVTVAPAASEAAVGITVVTGLSIVSSPAALRITPNQPGQVSLRTPVYDGATGERVAYRGATAFIGVSGLPEATAPHEVALTLNGVVAPVLEVHIGRLTFLIPSEVQPGPVVARLRVRGLEAPPVLLTVVDRPPVVTGVFDDSGTLVTEQNPARKGRLLQLVVKDLAPFGAAERISVYIGGVAHAVLQMGTAASNPPIHVLIVILGADVSSGGQVQVPVVVSADGRESKPVFIPVTG